MQSLWRDARAAPLDGLTEDEDDHPVDDCRSLESGSRARSAEVGETSLGVPRGQSPPASLA